MKKLSISIIVALFSFVFVSCDSNSYTFSEMRSICKDIEENFEKYTENDIEKLTARFSELEKKMELRELTEKEEKEFAKLKGRYYGSFTKGAIKSAKKEIEKISDKISNTVEGFIEGVK